MVVLAAVKLIHLPLAALPASPVVSTLSGLNVAHQVHLQVFVATALALVLKVAVLAPQTVEYAKLNGVETKLVIMVKPVALVLEIAVHVICAATITVMAAKAVPTVQMTVVLVHRLEALAAMAHAITESGVVVALVTAASVLRVAMAHATEEKIVQAVPQTAEHVLAVAMAHAMAVKTATAVLLTVDHALVLVFVETLLAQPLKAAPHVLKIVEPALKTKLGSKSVVVT